MSCQCNFLIFDHNLYLANLVQILNESAYNGFIRNYRQKHIINTRNIGYALKNLELTRTFKTNEDTHI